MTLPALLALFLLPSLAARAGGAPIVVGQAIDLSGGDGAVGRDYVAGIKTYFDSINAKGGINGRLIRYVVRDDQGKPELTARWASELIDADRADYLLGGIGDPAVRAVLDAPSFRRSGLILFAPLSAARPRPDDRVLFWRPDYRQEIRFLLAHFGRLGIGNVGIAYQESPANEEALRSLSAEIRERGLKTAGIARIGSSSIGGEQIVQEASRLAATGPGFVVVIADAIGTGVFLKEFRRHADKTFVAGTSLVNLSTLREVAGAGAMEWTVFSQVVPNPNSSSSLLQAEHGSMMKKYRDEAVSSLTLEGFAAAKALAMSIGQARTGRSALHDLLARNGDIELGGLTVSARPKSGHLSTYLDIALSRKGSGLVF